MRIKQISEEKQNIYEMVFWWIFIIFTVVNQGAYFAKELFLMTIALVLYAVVVLKTIRLDGVFLCFTGVLVCASLSAVFFSVDSYSAITELCKYMLLIVSYLIFYNSNKTDKIEKIFFFVLVLIMICGMLGYTDMGLFSNMITEKGRRLQSFFNYANTTALCMGIGVFLSVEKYKCEKKLSYILYSILFFTALILTASRTTIVLFIVAFSVYMLFILPKKQRFLAAVILGMSVVLLTVIGGRIVKISLTEPTFIERIITYIDAVKVLTKSFFGAGVGNWQFLQFANQSAPYRVRYIHNWFLQIGTDCGVVAVLLFVLPAIYLLLKNYKNRNVYYYITCFILVHSFFEVNFNFGFMIVFYSFVLIRMNTNKNGKEFKLLDKKLFRYIGKAVGCILCLMLGLLFISESMISSGDKAIKSNKEYAKEIYCQAYTLNPLNSEILFKIAQAEREADVAISYLEKALVKNPYQHEVVISLAKGYQYKKEYGKALQCAEHLFKIFPYEKEHQRFLTDMLDECYESGAIEKNLHESKKKEYSEKIKQKNADINHLYMFISPELNY